MTLTEERITKTNNAPDNLSLLSRGEFCVGLVLVILTLAIALFADLQVTHAIMNQNSLFGTLFQDFGEFAPTLIQVISIAIGLHLLFRKRISPAIVVPTTVLMGLFATNACYRFGTYVTSYVSSWRANIRSGAPIGVANNDSSGKLDRPTVFLLLTVSVIVTVAVIVVVHVLLSRFEDIHVYYLVGVAVAGLLFTFIGNDAIESLKHMWGRFRPYEVGVDSEHFTNWLTINGKNGHKSFPSGHTFEGTSLVFLTYLIRPDQRRKRRIVFALTIAFALLMAASRVRIGAHFLGDVTFSFGLTLSLILIAGFALEWYYSWLLQRQES